MTDPNKVWKNTDFFFLFDQIFFSTIFKLFSQKMAKILASLIVVNDALWQKLITNSHFGRKLVKVTENKAMHAGQLYYHKMKLKFIDLEGLIFFRDSTYVYIVPTQCNNKYPHMYMYLGIILQGF
jgi:hypothetical protein